MIVALKSVSQGSTDGPEWLSEVLGGAAWH